MSLPALDELLRTAVDKGAAPGFVATVVSPDGVLYEGAAGEAEGRPFDQDTTFAIASMTKAMTSVAALQLIERGELSLDQTVESVLPEFGKLQVLEGFDGDTPRLRPPATKPTIKQLMTHTSGLSYWFAHADLLRWHELTGNPDPLSAKRACIEIPLVHDPGQVWEYGVSTDWLGQVVEKLSGQTLDAYLSEHVWGPLGMTRSGFHPTEDVLARRMPLMSRGEDGSLVPNDLEFPAEPEIQLGGGGAFSTAHDYGRFLRMLLRGGELDGARILEPATCELLFTDHLDGVPLPDTMESARPDLTNPVPKLPFEQGWGLGLNLVLEDIPGMRRAGTGNWAGLFNCYFWVDRSSGIAAALMTQVLPFFDLGVVETLVGFEMAVYANLAAPAPA